MGETRVSQRSKLVSQEIRGHVLRNLGKRKHSRRQTIYTHQFAGEIKRRISLPFFQHREIRLSHTQTGGGFLLSPATIQPRRFQLLKIHGRFIT